MSKKAKIIIIVVSIIVLLAIIGITAYFIIRNMKVNESVGTTWGDTYYAYLKGVKTYSDKTEYGLPSNSNNVSVEFIQATVEKDPVMVMSYQENSTQYSNVYYISNEGNVEYSQYTTQGSLEFLYNIENEKYSWYMHTAEENLQKYQSLENITEVLLGETTETEEISFEENDFIRNEENMNVSEFDKIFVETEISNEGKINIDFNSDNLDFRDEIVNAVNGYKTDEELTTDEIKQNISTRVEELKQIEEEQKKQEELEKVKLTTANVNTRIGNNLKWFSAAYLGSTYGWYYVYDYEDVTGEVSIPGVDQYMMVDEVVGAGSIENMKNSLAEYMTTDVINRLASNSEFDYGFEEYNGKVYWVTGGVGDGYNIDYDKAEVISSDGVTSKVLVENYNAIGNTKFQDITVTVTYENDKYMITDYEVENSY